MATLSTDAPISPLRQRMQHDMLMRGLGSHTQQDYVRHLRRFAVFLGRSPDTATAADIRRFQLHQHESGGGPATINWRRLGTAVPVPRDAEASGSGACAGDHEVLAQAARGAERGGSGAAARSRTRHQVQGRARRRLSRGPARVEVAHLKIDDIDSTRMLIRVEQGKGRRDRNAMLSLQFLELLRLWWREGRWRGVMLPHR
ncbi:site-specific integrase [Mesorhizobium sp. M1148]|uniref:phage integrase N-terminal SAM-like domain-containing protein n=1 Tax=unclassified Mesorhizobium TaxID=325217 RepID=UPI00333D5AB6